MPNPMIRIHNSETNKIIDREMTKEEFTAYELQQADDAAKGLHTKAKAEAKSALLERLGITADEAALLLQ